MNFIIKQYENFFDSIKAIKDKIKFIYEKINFKLENPDDDKIYEDRKELIYNYVTKNKNNNPINIYRIIILIAVTSRKKII